MKYEPGHFAAAYNKNGFGPKLWDFLTDPFNIVRLVTATKLHRPAVEGVSEELIAEFGKIIREDKNKQLAGHMIRQILEAQGFEHDKHNIAVRFGGLFKLASRYKRKEKK